MCLAIVTFKKVKILIFNYNLISFFFAGLSMCSIMIALLGLSYLLFDPLVKHMVLSKLVLRNNSGFAELWKNPPIKPHFKVYFFNLTNAEDFINGKANPHVQEIGPYTYQ